MHPYHWYHRGPSRLLWFIIGAGTASWWIKSKDAHNFKVRHCSRHQIPPESYQAPAPVPPPSPADSATPQPSASVPAPGGYQAQTQAPPRQQQNAPSDWGWGWNSSWSPIPPSSPSSPPPPPPFERWDEEKVRMQELGRQANEKFTEISEATLDTVLSTVETLKAKLAEHRAQREQQARELQAMREEQMRQYEEWKKSQPPRHIV